MQNPPSSDEYAAVIPPSLSFLRKLLPTSFIDCLILFARKQILASLEKGIRTGPLEIIDSTSEESIVLGQPQAGKNDPSTKNLSVGSAAELTVLDSKFWLRVFLSYDIGFSEAYMTGEFDTPDLKTLLNVYVDNLRSLGGLSSPFYKALRAFDIFLTYFFSHGISKSVENVAGYNASNDFYKAFLSQEMTYSCPIWGQEEGGVRGDLEGHRRPGDLEAAQARKIAHLLVKARLSPGSRLLEIGTGWGPLAIAAARMGCTVDTITISTEQYEGAQENVANAGVADKVSVHLMDYRHLPESFCGAFDACISVEMLEAVGIRNMKTYLSKIDWALKKDRAFVVVTATTYPEATYTPYQGNDFTRKYHWPNGVCPSPTSLLNSFEKHVPRRFCVDTVEDFGDHYPRCLREWGRRLEENWTDELASSLTDRYPQLHDVKSMEMFRRKWRYMFAYMDVAYSRRWLGLTLWVMKRPYQEKAVCS